MAWATTSRQSRGYGKEWTKLREQVLRRDNGLCQCKHCKAEGRITIATEVDHRTPKAQGGTDDLSNLRSVSKECHRRITLEQQGKTYRSRRTIGRDGYPVTSQ